MRRTETEQATLERHAIKYFVRGEAFPAELKAYHTALTDLVAAKVSTVMEL